MREGRAGVLPSAAAKLVAIAEHTMDLPHGGEGGGFGLRRAAGHDNAVIGVLPRVFADGLARLCHGFGRDRACVEYGRILEPGGVRVPPDYLRLEGIEPAPEGHHVDAHGVAPAATTTANSAGSKRPSYS